MKSKEVPPKGEGGMKVVSPFFFYTQYQTRRAYTMDEITTIKDLNDEFAGFTGTEHYYRHWIPEFVYTDGIKMMAENYQAYWLIDIVLSYQSKLKEYKFQIWEIECETDSVNKRANVIMRPDSDEPIVVNQHIAFTTFPEGKLKMYYIDDGSNKVLLLPSEY
jgi:hypothetical protein